METAMLNMSSPRLVALAALGVLAPATLEGRAQSSTERERPSGAPAAETTQAAEARAVHVLSRLTFGPRPGDVERLLRTGVDPWIAEQLRADSSIDREAAIALDGCWPWTAPVAGVIAELSGPVTLTLPPSTSNGSRIVVAGGMPPLVTRDSARRARTGAVLLDNGQLVACRLARVEASNKQLLEVMTDFWENHFSVYATKLPSRASIVEWDRSVIRPRALGRFRDLLGAVARSPAMLAYLDNAVSTVDSSH